MGGARLTPTMNACKRFSSKVPLLSLSVVAALAAAACTVESNDPGQLNARVENVTVVGTSVTSALYVSGELGLTTVPKDAAGEAVLGPGLKVGIRITAPVQLAATVASTECTVPDSAKKAISVGVIIDDSGSMSSSDPNKLRKAATISFLNTLGAEDKVLLTDYGKAGNDLRDLLCLSNPNAAAGSCTPPKPSFSADKAALIKAAELIDDGGGTPLYGSCAQMIPLVDSMKDTRRGVLLLSDGKPTDTSKRALCHDAAKAAGIPVFTVGLGPAAEGSQNADPDAVKVLRELSTDTGGGYASANAPAELDGLFRNMGTALSRGSCRTTATVADAASKIVPGTKVTGEVTVGDKGATASFEFVAPAKN